MTTATETTYDFIRSARTGTIHAYVWTSGWSDGPSLCNRTSEGIDDRLVGHDATWLWNNPDFCKLCAKLVAE